MEASSTIFWVFGMTWPGIEPRSLRPLANTLTIMPMSGIIVFLSVVAIEKGAFGSPSTKVANNNNKSK